MKLFRHIIITALLTIGAFSTVLYTGCKDKCGSTTCQNGGVCTNNICVCPTGYSGNNCGTSWTGQYVGTYQCTRGACSPAVAGSTSWQSAITVDATYGGYEVDISNFDGASATYAVATVDSAGTTLDIVPGATGGLAGTGTRDLTTGTIVLHYTTASAAGVGGYSCTMTMTKLQ